MLGNRLKQIPDRCRKKISLDDKNGEMNNLQTRSPRRLNSSDKVRIFKGWWDENVIERKVLVMEACNVS